VVNPRSKCFSALCLPCALGFLILCPIPDVASADDAEAILDAHNAYRAKHCAPALTWSADLAAAAQQWADGCKFTHSGVVGESLAWGTNLSGQGAVDMWYGEIGKYNFAAPVWSTAVGHFTQIVWKNSTQIGCARAKQLCSGMSFWVCRYQPPGNWNVDVPGELTKNVLDPSCANAPPASGIESVPKPQGGTGNFLKQMKP
jgi:hypothetical protein